VERPAPAVLSKPPPQITASASPQRAPELPTPKPPQPLVLPGQWGWPVPRWDGRAPVISDGFGSPRPGMRHMGVDIMFARIASDPFPVGTPNGTKGFVMPDAWMAVAAGDGILWSSGHTPRGFAVVIDHGTVATFYTHLDTLFVPQVKPPTKGLSPAKVIPIKAGQPLGVIGGDPQTPQRIKHLLCAAAHNRCNAERPLCRAVGTRPRSCSGSPRSAAHNAGTAEVVEPREQISRREAVVRHLRQRRRHCRHGGLLHPKVDLYVSVCGRELGVAKPRGDRGDVDAGHQKMHGRRVSQHVRRHGLRVTCRDLRASDQSTKNVGDAGAAQALTSGVEKQRRVLIAGCALIEPRLDRSDSTGPERTRALPSTLADDRHVRNRVEADVADVQIDEFLDAQAGVVQHEHKRSVSKAVARVRRFDDAGDLVFLEVAHFDVFGTRQGHLANSAAPLHVFRGNRRGVSREGLDRGEPMIASARTASALAFEMFEERSHDGHIEGGVIELLGASTQTGARETEEQLEGVAIREHGVAARVSLGGEVFLEEALHQRLQGDCW
jgi:hypothetical protein